MRHHISVLDDFYPDPTVVRKAALRLDFTQKPGATYPGLEAICPSFDWQTPWAAMREYIREEVQPDGPKDPPFPQGKFRIAIARDADRRIDGVHVDEQPWSGVVYLTPDEHHSRAGAVGFYRHKETGLLSAAPEWWAYITAKLEFAYLSADKRHSRFWSYMREPEHWVEIDRVENRFNRALLLNAHQFHASIGLFGDSQATGRLTQHFEFYHRQEADAPNIADSARDEDQPQARGRQAAPPQRGPAHGPR